MSIKDLIAKKRADPALHGAWIVADMAKAAGAILRKLRKQKGITQEDIAAALDISQPRVSQLENGKVQNMPPLDLMALYADACGDSLVLITATELNALVAERDALKTALDEKAGADPAASEVGGRAITGSKPWNPKTRRSARTGKILPANYPHTLPSSKSGAEK